MKALRKIIAMPLMALVLVGTLILVSSCKSENDDSDEALAMLMFFGTNSGNSGLRSHLNVDLSESSSLMISSGLTSTSSFDAQATGEDGLYVIGEDGTIVKVEVFQENSQYSYTPIYIESLKDYVLLAYSGWAPCTVVLARISDDALFCAYDTGSGDIFYPNAYYDASGGEDYSSTFQSDNAGNVYMNGRMIHTTTAAYPNSSIFKIDLTDPAHATIQKIIDGEIYGSITKYLVAGNGNLMVETMRDETSYDATYGFRWNSGSIDSLNDQIPSSWYYHAINWSLTPGGQFYMYDSVIYVNNGNKPSTSTLVLDATGNPVTGSETLITGKSDWDRNASLINDSYNTVLNCNTAGNSYWGFTTDPALFKYNADSATPTGDFINLGTGTMEHPSRVVCGESHVFAKGARSGYEDAIVLYSEQAGTVTTLLDGGYVVSAMSVDSEGLLTFGGADLSTGNHVIGEIDPENPGTVRIISNEAPEIKRLVQLN